MKCSEAPGLFAVRDAMTPHGLLAKIASFFLPLGGDYHTHWKKLDATIRQIELMSGGRQFRWNGIDVQFGRRHARQNALTEPPPGLPIPLHLQEGNLLFGQEVTLL